MHEHAIPTLEELLQHTRWVEDLAQRLVGDPAAAQDLAQSTWLVALRSRERPRSDVRRWLGAVVRNLARERHRREAQRGAIELAGARKEALPSSLELLARAEAERKLAETVMELGEPHRTTLLLRYFEGLAPEEIARRQGLPLASVTHRITRAHARLRERLGEREGAARWFAALAPILRREAPAGLPQRNPMASPLLKLVAGATLLVVAGFLVLRSRTSSTESALADLHADPATERAHETPSELASSDVRAPARVEAPAEAAPSTQAPVADAPPASVAAATGGRIHGRVFRPDAQPAAGRRVRLLNMAPVDGKGSGEIFSTCDDQGRFDQHELGAGVWSVSTWPEEAELKNIGIAYEGTLGGLSFLAERTVDLGVRGDLELELGAPPRHPIHIRGNVRRAGKPVAATAIQWLPAGEGMYDLKKNARATTDGQYEVTLEQPGTYYVTAILDRARPEWSIDVQAERELTLDFEIEPNVLEGRVVESGDRPVAQAAVELSLRAERHAPLLLSSIALATTTDAEGRFRFEGLPEASYVVHAFGGELAGSKAPGGAVASQIVRAAPPGTAREVVLALAPGVRVPVQVFDAQGKEKYASVFVFDADGEALDPATGQLGGKSGARTLIPLAPGRYSAVAASGNAWSLPREFEIVAGEEPRALELRLQPAALVVVDASACPRALVEACDEGGRRFGSLIDRARFNRAVERCWQAEKPLLRLPAGNYEISARGVQGVEARVRAGLVAGDNHALVLHP